MPYGESYFGNPTAPSSTNPVHTLSPHVTVNTVVHSIDKILLYNAQQQSMMWRDCIPKSQDQNCLSDTPIQGGQRYVNALLVP